MVEVFRRVAVIGKVLEHAVVEVNADMAVQQNRCQDLTQAKAELKQARPQMVLSPATAQAVEAAANRLKQG